jgi:hypothetical protein
MPSFESPFCANVLWFNLYAFGKKKQKTYFDIIFTFLLQMMMNMPLSPIGDAPHVSGRNFGDF